MEVLFPCLKNKNCRGKKKRKKRRKRKKRGKKKKKRNPTKTSGAGSAARGQWDLSGARVAPGKKSPKQPISPLFPSPGIFFLAGREAQRRAAQPGPSATRSAPLPAYPKIGFIPRIYSAAAAAGIFLSANKTVRWTRGLLSARRDFSPYSPIFHSVPLLFHHHPIFSYFFHIPLFFFLPNQNHAKQKMLGEKTRKSCERINI